MGIPVHHQTGDASSPRGYDRYRAYVSSSDEDDSPPTVGSVLRYCLACYTPSRTGSSLTACVQMAVDELTEWMDLWPDQDSLAFYDMAVVLTCAHALCAVSAHLQQPVDDVTAARARQFRETLLTGICDRQQEDDVRDALLETIFVDLGFSATPYEQWVDALRQHLADPGRYPLSP